jgi:hypothetical protein
MAFDWSNRDLPRTLARSAQTPHAKEGSLTIPHFRQVRPSFVSRFVSANYRWLSFTVQQPLPAAAIFLTSG